MSPLKALSADIHKNLSEPRRGLRRVAEELGLEAPRLTAAVRTGDTSQTERAAMLRTPPHILVTTPESLYLLLTAERSRAMLRTVRTVIVDEIHAMFGTRRGAHLALSLERLQQVAAAPLIRIGLSATQRPLEEVARFLVGTNNVDGAGLADCAIVDEGHRRAIDLDLEIPRSALEAVMSHEVWEEYYDRLTRLIQAHRTTLVFVNTRRMAERIARQLSERLGEDGDGAPRQPVEGQTAECRGAAQGGELKALWLRHRSSSGSISATSIWRARLAHRTGLRRSSSGLAGPGIPCPGRQRAGSSPPLGTISSSALPCCAPCDVESWTLSSPKRRRSMC